LKKFGDLFAPVLKLKQKLPAEFGKHAGPVSTPPRSHASRKRRSLAQYEAKRQFDRTSEPAPGAVRRSEQGSKRRFVVQKHAASHLHYDFRLEMQDVLKSWAVPKGLPLQKGERHTGFETEDHPLEYLEFEGIIPQGQYGGGTVMVWDIGTYEVIDGNYWKGAFSLFLTGHKLKGEWTLTRLESEDEKTKWLIAKTSGNARPISKRREAASARSGKTMEQIAGKGAAVWRSDREVNGSKCSTANPQRPTLKKEKRTAAKREAEGRSGAAAKFVKPMKATAVAQLPEGDEWIYEIKWDGYRAMALKQGNEVRLLSLKEKNLTSDFPDVAQAIGELEADTAVIDGEIVAVNAEGCPSFQVLQNRKKLGRGWSIVYYAFDLLSVEGKDLLHRPLRDRKARLNEVIETSGSGVIRYNADLTGSAKTILATVAEAGLEGVVAKQRDSLYRAGARVTSWLKFKINKAQEFVIGGYKPDGSSFQSILPGYYDGRDLVFAGKVRQGFNPAVRARLLAQMRPLLTTSCPFSNLPGSRRSHFGEGITAEEMNELCWLKPQLVAQISFTEWTNYGLLRHATFEGLREDKEPRDVVREVA
jgi:bifunctional non-homologous end joining protein LigD